ncbi:MAG: hypothetical protein K940chlam7_00223 [Chlamydiae bacterium]|nr:hypothetical protein [Chlamydiota bacterium]
MLNKKKLTNTNTTLLLIWLGHFLTDVMIGFWAIYKTMAHLDLALAGIIAAACPFIGEGLQVVFGSIGDKGYRKILLLFGIGAASANVFLSYTNNYFLLFLIYLSTCLGSGAFHPTAVAIASGLTKERKGLFVTIFASGGAVGLATSQLIFSSSYTYFNGNTFFLALPTLGMLLFLLFKTLPGTLPIPAQPGRRFGFTAMKKLFSNRELVILYASQVCNQAIFWGTIFLLPDVLMTKGYNSWISLGGGHLFFILGGAVMMVPGGYLSDKYSPRFILLVTNLFAFALFYTFLLAPSLPNGLLLSLLFALGAGLGIANPVAVAYGNRILPSRPGLVSALLMGLVWCISESLGPGGGGLLTKCFVENAPTKALLLFGFLFLVGGLITALLPKEVSPEFEIEQI